MCNAPPPTTLAAHSYRFHAQVNMLFACFAALCELSGVSTVIACLLIAIAMSNSLVSSFMTIMRAHTYIYITSFYIFIVCV
jgi:hypothetical protein